MATRTVSRSCLQRASNSAARAFLQISPPQKFHLAPPILDFLLPSISTKTILRHSNLRTSIRCDPSSAQPFSTSTRRQATTVLLNPRKDDDGNDMTVEITPRASKRLSEIMTKDSNPNLALRIQVESGGCHGFQYLMSLTTLSDLPSTQEESPPALNTSSSDPNTLPSSAPNPSIQEESPPALDTSSSGPNAMPSSTPSESNTDELEEDTIFAAADGTGAKVVMDGPSLELLKGSKIDFTMELIGSQFKIVDNPLATSSCGCGTSFDIKV